MGLTGAAVAACSHGVGGDGSPSRKCASVGMPDSVKVMEEEPMAR
ncbi:hypothetical protein SHJG_p1064 (plasmid) [Streptomyces hygroscopicus subsp. jinggangensis 5008]|nr:hypothetical protein SHJG_p1064 [Streptomyces hygroscopicus subsp. jinggangensis 5008]AGF68349.1 hypothetical protein SHJGH_p1064 [Streptomyces hygroscopicus subsp. jinggangensis TL01]